MLFSLLKYDIPVVSVQFLHVESNIHCVFGSGPQVGSYFINNVYRSRTQTCTCAKSLNTHPHTHIHPRSLVYTPEVTDFPGSRVEERGGDKQTREAAPVEPGSCAMPLVYRQEIQHRPAYQTWKDPKLDGGKKELFFLTFP